MKLPPLGDYRVDVGSGQRTYHPALAGLWHFLSLMLLLVLLVVGIGCVARGDFLERVEAFVEGNSLAGVLLYPVIFALCNVLLLPGGILSVLSGYLFGLFLGVPLVLLGSVMGAAIAFSITRQWARGFVEKRLLSRPRWRAFDLLIEERGAMLIILSQLNPLFPTSLINYLYGATRVRFLPCMAWIAVGQAPGLILYVFLGTLGRAGMEVMRGQATFGVLQMMLAIAGLLLTLVCTLGLGVVAAGLWKEASKRSVQEDPGVWQANQPPTGNPANPGR